MYFCMTEEQKREIGALLKMVESLKKVWDDLISVFRKFVCVLVRGFQKVRHEPTPRERYKIVKRLNRCGFNEKEVNLMIFRVYRCRNSC